MVSDPRRCQEGQNLYETLIRDKAAGALWAHLLWVEAGIQASSDTELFHSKVKR